jgi:hypothetical protein
VVLVVAVLAHFLDHLQQELQIQAAVEAVEAVAAAPVRQAVLAS